MANEHEHRRPRKADFVGKTIMGFRKNADNKWTITFMDGSTVSIWAELAGIGNGMSLPILELCEGCK